MGRMERLKKEDQEILEAAAIVHDIGIHRSEEKYGRNTGRYQEIEGPPEAEKLLASQGWPETVIQRVSYLVGHHHTYTDIDGMDYQLLVEADFLVNLFEEGALPETREDVFRRIFRTESGKYLFQQIFSPEDRVREPQNERTCDRRKAVRGQGYRQGLKMPEAVKRGHGGRKIYRHLGPGPSGDPWQTRRTTTKNIRNGSWRIFP